MDERTQVLTDPLWLPHRWLRDRDSVSFLKLDARAFAQPAFLADRVAERASDRLSLPIAALGEAPPHDGQLHFIFHTAFCRSTLLARALNIRGHSVGMSEPAILADCAGGAGAAPSLIADVTRLLARPHPGSQGDVRTIFVKPTNLANRLIPALMEAAPNAKAILISHDLPSFLSAINRRGLMGRHWVRNLYLQVQGYAPLDLGLERLALFALTDMQVAGLAWLLQRRWFAQNMARFGLERMGSVDSDAFNADRLGTLEAVCRFVSAPVDRATLAQAMPDGLFDHHSKLGGDYAARDRNDRARSASAVFEEEAAMVGEWIANIMGQAGLGERLGNPIAP